MGMFDFIMGREKLDGSPTREARESGESLIGRAVRRRIQPLRKFNIKKNMEAGEIVSKEMFDDDDPVSGES